MIQKYRGMRASHFAKGAANIVTRASRCRREGLRLSAKAKRRDKGAEAQESKRREEAASTDAIFFIRPFSVVLSWRHTVSRFELLTVSIAGRYNCIFFEFIMDQNNMQTGGGVGKTSSSIKSLLLEAWRERWTEIEWGVNIKRVLPRGVSGDVYDLADCILQQSLIGPLPNALMISYLEHSVSSRTVSYGAVINAISQYEEFNKFECVACLVDVIAKFKLRIGCSGNEEECVGLCKAIVGLSAWLFACLAHFIAEIKSSGLSQTQNQFSSHQVAGAGAASGIISAGLAKQYTPVLEKICDILSYFASTPIMRAFFYIGKTEDPEAYRRVIARCSEIDSKSQHYASTLQPLINAKEVLDNVLNFKRIIEWNGESPGAVVAHQMRSSSKSCMSSIVVSNSVFSSLSAVIVFDAILNPVSEIDVCAEQIMMIAKFNDMAMSELYCEIIRACFIGLVDSSGTSEELKWAAFTFLKIPKILFRIHSSQYQKDSNNNDIEIGLEKLLTYTPLLDLTDSKANCDCLQLFLVELSKTELLSELKMKKILAKRQVELARSPVLAKLDQGQSGQAGSSLILRAEPTVTSILKTLDSDYSKNQEALLGVLCHMVPGKSFELILNAAAATGKLRSFTTKLLKFNEFNKQVTGESGKASQTRAQLFDITFLMLCHIAQNYGNHIIIENSETKDSFFATWCAQSLAEEGRYRCPDLVLTNCDPNRVDIILNQFTSTDTEFKTSLVKWQEVCQNSPAAIKEVLLAWEHGAISTDNVKLILDNVKSRMCCLPVVISAWICSYINILHHEERLKPMNMLQQFMTPLTNDGSAPPPPAPATPTPATGDAAANGAASGPEQSNLFYKERSTLMATIIKKMLYDLHPPQQTKLKGAISVISHGITVKNPLMEIIETNFALAQHKSWLDLKAVHNMDTLLSVGGPDWFVDSLIRQLMKCEHANELDRGVSLVFGLFHLDTEQCALSLLSKVLPNYLLNENKQELFFEPKASALARLTVMSIFAAANEFKKPASKNSRKRSHPNSEHSDHRLDAMDIDQEDHKPGLKNLEAMRSGKFGNLDVSGLIARLDDTPYAYRRMQSGSDDKKSTFSNLSDPFTKAVANLLSLLNTIISDSSISQRTLFPIVFLEQLILCAKSDALEILQFLPLQTIMSLIKIIPENISYEFLLAISNIETLKSRKVVARALCQLSRAKRLSDQ